MKQRLIVVGGMLTPLVIGVICLGSVLLLGVLNWLFFQSDEPPQIIQIMQLAPLVTSVAAPAAIVAEDVGETPVPTPAALAADIPTPSVIGPPAPTPDVEQILGFDLPAGAVNSITQEGVASRLVIPKLKVDAPVVVAPVKDQSWQVDHLGQMVGHLEGTAAPGSSSNVVLAGHITLAQGVYGPFAGLAQLTAGDILTVYQGEQKFDYIVDGYDIVEKTAIDVTYPTSTGQLTLITCNNWNSDTGRYEQRLVVKSHLAAN